MSYRLPLHLAAAILAAAPLSALQQPIPFDARWQLTGEGSQVLQAEGRSALQLTTGIASLPDFRLQDGTVDVDVRFPDQRAFLYLMFRMQSPREYEEFYLRPHKNDLPDAVQYAPVLQGNSAWQFYHGPGGTAAIALPPDQWVRVRLVLQGRQAALFVGDTLTPALVVPRLAREPAAGYIALRSFVPPQDRPGPYGAQFANLVVRPSEILYQFPPVATPTLPAGLITAWEVSRAFVPDTGTRQVIAAEAIAAGMEQVSVEPDKGFVLLHRHVAMPAGVRRVGTVARVTVRAATAGLRRFSFGFSDEVSVYLNGTLLYSGDARYAFDQPRREGLIGLDQGSLYLPLRAGDNDLTLVVVDGFGGWGVMGQFEDPTGLTFRPGGGP